MIKDVKLSGTTDGAGAATVTATEAVRGRLIAYALDASAFDATADTTVSVTGGSTGVDQAVETHTNYNSAAWHYQQVQAEDNTGAPITGDYVDLFVEGKFKIVVAAGGVSKAFSAHFFVEVQ